MVLFADMLGMPDDIDSWQVRECLMHQINFSSRIKAGVLVTAVFQAACSGPDAPPPAVAGVSDSTQPTAGSVIAVSENAAAWEHPMTAWGDPDLQGIWPVGHMTSTPLERPVEFGERAQLTDEEYARRVESLDTRSAAYDNENTNNRIGIGHWAETGSPQRQASLIVDPADGRLPALTAAGRQRAETMGSSWNREVFDSIEDFDSWDRCITRGLPMSMFPFHYNNGIEIMQSPGYVVIRLEMIHETRIIPVDGRPSLDSKIRHWLGESRGRWEGDTLVIETTNFNGQGTSTNRGTVGTPRVSYPVSQSFRMVERLSRVSDDRIDYTATIEDPEFLTTSWTVKFPLILDPGYQFFEYACHEDNSAVRNFIETSRFERGIVTPGHDNP